MEKMEVNKQMSNLLKRYIFIYAQIDSFFSTNNSI